MCSLHHHFRIMSMLCTRTHSPTHTKKKRGKAYGEKHKISSDPNMVQLLQMTIFILLKISLISPSSCVPMHRCMRACVRVWGMPEIKFRTSHTSEPSSTSNILSLSDIAQFICLIKCCVFLGIVSHLEPQQACNPPF